MYHARLNRILPSLCLLLLAACFWPADPDSRIVIPADAVPDRRQGEAHEYVFVLGDMGTGKEDQHKVAEVMVSRAREIDLEFMLTLGDNFYEEGVDSVDDPGWDTKFEDIYSDPLLRVPVFPSLGNHDHRGNVDAQVAYSESHPLWRMPSRYYSFRRVLDDGTTVEFFALDTTPIHNQDEEAQAQADWLDGELTGSTAAWKIVYGHHPLYSNSHHKGSEAMREAVEEILVRHQIDLFLAGHNHIMEVLTPKKGIQHVVAGAAAGPYKAHKIEQKEDTIYVATGGGVVLMRLGTRNLVLEFIRMDGSTEYSLTLDRRKV